MTSSHRAEEWSLRITESCCNMKSRFNTKNAPNRSRLGSPRTLLTDHGAYYAPPGSLVDWGGGRGAPHASPASQTALARQCWIYGSTPLGTPPIVHRTRDLRIGRRLPSNRIWIESKEMCGTTDSSFQSSNTLNNTGVWSPIELASLYTVPQSAVNGLSRLTTTSNGQARPIRKYANRPMTFEWNRMLKLRGSLYHISCRQLVELITANSMGRGGVHCPHTHSMREWAELHYWTRMYTSRW